MNKTPFFFQQIGQELAPAEQDQISGATWYEWVSTYEYGCSGSGIEYDEWGNPEGGMRCGEREVMDREWIS